MKHDRENFFKGEKKYFLFADCPPISFFLTPSQNNNLQLPSIMSILIETTKGSIMSKITFTGESGKKYSFVIHPMTTLFKEVGAVYFVTHRFTDDMNKVNHQHVFVGETDNLAKQFDRSDNQYFRRHQANCICIHPEDDRKTRLKIESDLVGNYNPPCNQ
jgi:hypothetical protein